MTDSLFANHHDGPSAGPLVSVDGDTSSHEAMKQIGEESPDALALVGSLLQASAQQNLATMDRLYESEKRRRMILEALIDETIDRLEDAHMGSAREYERAVRDLRFGGHGREGELLARHRENYPL